MRILLIEDEPSVASFIRKGLEENGMLVTQAFDGATGLTLALREEFDVIVLDIVMPGMNGLDVCKQIRTKHGMKTPILMLTALGTTEDIVEGLTTGADDYLPKPFKFKELLARINALTRRGKTVSQVLRVADLELNRESKEVTRNNRPIELTAREFRLLEYLLINKNRVVSRVDILENVWDINHDLGTNVVDVYINYLRKKIDADFGKPLIKTVVGMGYIIKEVDRETEG
ncbi:MAG: response regulator transcription factor [Flammeovirgaceae bacterium]|nr:MAG: response regulator transcription factor [Flammeovirgaceae bacterium]